MALRFDGWLVVDGELMGPNDPRFPADSDRQKPNVRDPTNEDISMHMFNVAMGESRLAPAPDGPGFTLDKIKPLFNTVQDLTPSSTPHRPRPTDAATRKKDAETHERTIETLAEALDNPLFPTVFSRDNLIGLDAARSARDGAAPLKDAEMAEDGEIESDEDMSADKEDEHSQYEESDRERQSDEVSMDLDSLRTGLPENEAADNGSEFTVTKGKKRGKGRSPPASPRPSAKRRQKVKAMRTPLLTSSPAIESDSTPSKRLTRSESRRKNSDKGSNGTGNRE
jgi:hypothetical protein